MNRISYYNIIAIIFCYALIASCEIDNYDAPDATVQGALFDHHGDPLQLNHGSQYIRMREVSWAKDNPDAVITSQYLRVQQDGTYINTKWFEGEYLMLPYQGNFFPYDDENRESDDAGELVKIAGTVTKNFTVTPYLTIDWVQKPALDNEGHLVCVVRFTRNQKDGYAMPNVDEGYLRISRSVNLAAFDSQFFPSAISLNNNREGDEITFRSTVPLKYSDIDYWVRVAIRCSNPSGTVYPGLPQFNCSTIEKIHIP
jgi:hypothetical protein